MRSEEQAKVKIEIDTETLNRLLLNRQLCVVDMRALDRSTKRLIWQHCLLTSIQQCRSA